MTEEHKPKRASRSKLGQLRDNLKRRYGITLEQYEAMLAAQGGTCALCPTPTPGGKGRFHVDHCHDTGKVRGLLCMRCNTGIGCLNHNTDTLLKAVAYLKAAHAPSSSP
jgi:hypothetical protein